MSERLLLWNFRTHFFMLKLQVTHSHTIDSSSLVLVKAWRFLDPCSAIFVPRRSWQKTTRLETEPARHTERITLAGPPVTSQQACMRALSFVKAGDPVTTIKPSPGWLCYAKRRLGVKSFYPPREAASAEADRVCSALAGVP